MRWIVNASDHRWVVRIDGRDVAVVKVEDDQVGTMRDMIAGVSGARVSMGREQNMKGTLVTVVPG